MSAPRPGWTDASRWSDDQVRTCDVCVVGSGAGGAVLAAGLAQAGLRVVVLEEGGRYRGSELTLREQDAYPAMYQERGTRATSDLAITIMQGRAVGGSTMVNWTTCFRTPEAILDHWAREHGLDGLDLAPHFEAVEERLSIATWPAAMANANNQTLSRGCEALGWQVRPLRRNVKGCANSGYCGVGCPVDGKQSMGITYLQDAVDAGAEVISRLRVETITREGARVTGVRGQAMSAQAGVPDGRGLRVEARVVVSAAGAINGPALLMRSGLGGGAVGRRTFLHPVIGVVARYAEAIAGYHGAPQSMGSHQFIDRGPDRIGFFLEAAPLQPMLAAVAAPQAGRDLQGFLTQLPHLSALLGLSVDGVLPGDDGGTVGLRRDGRIRLDYPISGALAEAFQAATRALAEIHLAAGAEDVVSLHTEPVILRSRADLPRLDAAPYGAHEHRIFTAHQMGGCAMGADPARHPVDLSYRLRGTDNLFVVDGSILPTSLGVNPSQTIYALAHRAVDGVRDAV